MDLVGGKSINEKNREKTVAEMSDDEIIVTLTVSKNMGVNLNAGSVHPRDLVKILTNIITDIQFSVMMPEQPNQRGLQQNLGGRP